MLSKHDYNKILETISYKVNDIVFIHFPNTDILTEATIIEIKRNKVLLSFKNNPKLQFCPNIYFNKINIVSNKV